MASPDPSPASELTAFFHAHRNTPVSIEFHPPHTPLLTSGLHIAIPKTHLLAAFPAAYHTFSTLHPTTTPWSASDARALLDATLILILVAAEHTTAVNTRRRILQLELSEDVVTPREEMALLQGVLTSHLAKHNKSPSLWGYRQWIVERCGVGVLGDGGLVGELEVVRRSGEAHPRNYYAWSYARFIVDKFYSCGDGSPCPGNDAPPPPPPPLLRELVESHAALCRTHVSDTSFWSFLLFLFWRARESTSSGDDCGYIFSITKDAAIYAHDMARGHESVWIFIRTVIVDEKLQLKDAERQELIGMVEGWVQEAETAGNEDEELVIEKEALRWISRRSTTASETPLAAEK
ncbi:uncharacterized protein LAJ45_00884 [Morchella importuna]|uniref:uncharacterized protein n=1 Tax=Morchella importuna TaxID=1174673 RepID=UPI001E8DA1E5|nr:uncharacterized protein LAJ45_00884 [Morchella importuna]KAH8155872.1 hypothetical protein LAJ45_00884 [Morchella importuna]